MSGFVYAIGSQSSNLIKIGWAVNAMARLRELQTGSQVKLQLLHSRQFDKKDAATAEAEVHKILRNSREHGEWFAVTQEVAEWAISSVDDEIAVITPIIAKQPAKPAAFRPIVIKAAPDKVELNLTEILKDYPDLLLEVVKWKNFYDRAQIQNRKNQKAWYDRQKAAKVTLPE